mgnify:FL=1
MRKVISGAMPPGLAAAIAMALAVGLVATPASAASAVGDPAHAAVTHDGETPADWAEVDDSVAAPARTLTADLDANDKARVVTVKDVDGAPVITAANVKGRTQATAVVEQQQAIDGAVAVAVQQKQRLVAGHPMRTSQTGRNVSSDPYSESQWALRTLEAGPSWSLADGSGQTVAVIDTGVSREPDLAKNLLVGWDVIRGRSDGRDDQNGHGTHVAGVIAAASNNGIGGAGLAPRAKVLPVRALDAAGKGYWSDVANGIVYAVNQGAGVINLSIGGDTDDPSLRAAVNYALASGRVVVAAVGNEGTGALTYPAAYPGVIGVAATDRSDRVADFSNSGSAVDLAAPGVAIMSTVPGGFASYSGTSMATPFVSATAALLRSAAVARGLGRVDVLRALQASAVDVDSPGVDSRSGAGRLSARNALCAAGACSYGLQAAASMKKRKLTVRLNRETVQRVILQRKVGKKWKQVSVRSTAASGVAVFKVKKRAKAYRVVVPATSETSAVVTRPLKVR